VDIQWTDVELSWLPRLLWMLWLSLFALMYIVMCIVAEVCSVLMLEMRLLYMRDIYNTIAVNKTSFHIILWIVMLFLCPFSRPKHRATERGYRRYTVPGPMTRRGAQTLTSTVLTLKFDWTTQWFELCEENLVYIVILCKSSNFYECKYAFWKT